MSDVIRRKIDRALAAQIEGAPGADRGWRLALARAARDAMGLDLDFRRMVIARMSLAELLELPLDRALLALLDGPETGLGLIVLSAPVLSALIECQTVGRVSPRPAAVRKPTRTDAAMVAGVIDRALEELDLVLAEEADLVWAGGFRYASFLEDARPLGLLLEEESYRVLQAEVSLAGGAKVGEVILALPANGRGQRPQARLEAELALAGPSFAEALGAQVRLTDCRLDAVMARLTLPLRQVMEMAVGDVLPLASAALETVALETLDGRRVSLCRLGQIRGMRAVRIVEAGQRAFVAPLPSVPAAPAAVPAVPEAAEESWRAAG